MTHLVYNFNTAEEIVDDLATLLTSGRLSDANRQLMTEAYNYTLSLKDDPYEAMVNVQQLMIASPEFQTTNTPSLTGEDRPLPNKPQSSGKPYKAVIYLMLSGGADSYNMLVPNICSGTNADGVPVSEQYITHRGVMAFNRTEGEFNLTISASSEQPCSSFAVHDELEFVKELYDDKDLLWIANAGVVNQNGMTKNNFNAKTKTQLFAHVSTVRMRSFLRVHLVLFLIWTNESLIIDSIKNKSLSDQLLSSSYVYFPECNAGGIQKGRPL